MCKLNLVTNDLDLKNKGDALSVFNKELGYSQLIIVCPGCGNISGSKGKHRYNKETKSYHPSIVHNVKYGGCGWHGWLNNGEFKKC